MRRGAAFVYGRASTEVGRKGGTKDSPNRLAAMDFTSSDDLGLCWLAFQASAGPTAQSAWLPWANPTDFQMKSLAQVDRGGVEVGLRQRRPEVELVSR